MFLELKYMYMKMRILALILKHVGMRTSTRNATQCLKNTKVNDIMIATVLYIKYLPPYPRLCSALVAVV